MTPYFGDAAPAAAQPPHGPATPSPPEPSSVPFTPDDAFRRAAKTLVRSLGDGRWTPVYAGVDDAMVVLLVPQRSPLSMALRGWRRELVSNALLRGDHRRLVVRRLTAGGGLGAPIDATPLLRVVESQPGAVDLVIGVPADRTPAGAPGMGLDALRSLAADAARRHPPLRPFLPRELEAPSTEAPADPRPAIEHLEREAAILVPHLRAGRLTLLKASPEVGRAAAALALRPGEFRDAVEAAAWVDVAPAMIGEDAMAPPARAGLAAALRHDPTGTIQALGARLSLGDAAPPSEGWTPGAAAPDVRRRRLVIALGGRDPSLAPLLHELEHEPSAGAAPPFDLAPAGPRTFPAPNRRSVLFLHESYYNFHYLAIALRRRGWDAEVVTLTDPEGSVADLTHSADHSLFDPDPARMLAKLRKFFDDVRDRFGIVHSYGRGTLNLFQHLSDTGPSYDSAPWDILEWKRSGALIGYTHSGCLDLVSQNAFFAWSGGMCELCPWRDIPEICSDDGNLAWGWKVTQLADVICAETEPLLDFKNSQQTWREPMTFALDPDVWRPDLEPPDRFRVEREPGEVVVFHAVGNFDLRTRDGVNVKGSRSVIRAIDRLREEGLPVRLAFAKDVPSRDMRYIQVQADIIVDQLNYGRYGAAAREAMMLGKPVVGKVEQAEPAASPPSECIRETPIVHATEESVYEVLRALVTDPDRRRRLGEESRSHALKWWGADPLAATFEAVYDSVRLTGRPPGSLS